jgi:hypothetical protein
MKRWLIRVLALAAALVGASWFNQRRKRQAWEDEPRAQAEWPRLQMDTADTNESSPVTEGSSGSWIDPLPDGNCPPSHPVKGKTRSGIFHVEGNISYERTNADRCYLSPEAAEADGYRPAKN